VIHHERDVREEQQYIYVARTSNNRVIAAHDLLPKYARIIFFCYVQNSSLLQYMQVLIQKRYQFYLGLFFICIIMTLYRFILYGADIPIF